MTRLTHCVLAIIASAGTLCAVGGTAHATQTPQSLGAFMGYGGGLTYGNECLKGNLYDDYSWGAKIEIYPCDEANYDSSLEHWQLMPDKTIHLMIGSPATDYGCLDIHNNDPTTGNVNLNPGTTWPCHNNAADEWEITSAGEIRAYNHTSYCLTAPTTVASDGIVGISECADGASGTLYQLWLPLEITFALNGPAVSGGCLDILNNDQSAGTPVDNYGCYGGWAQWFTFRPAPVPNDFYSGYWDAELWSTDENGNPSCMVDAYNTVTGVYGDIGVTATCTSTSTTPGAASQLFNFGVPGYINNATNLTYQLGNAFSDGNQCFVTQPGGPFNLGSPWNKSVYTTGVETCDSSYSVSQAWALVPVESGW